MVTIADVAAHAGVGAGTVSCAEPQPPRERHPGAVLAAIEVLDYRPNPLARGLSRGRCQTLGVVVPSPTPRPSSGSGAWSPPSTPATTTWCCSMSSRPAPRRAPGYADPPRPRRRPPDHVAAHPARQPRPPGELGRAGGAARHPGRGRARRRDRRCGAAAWPPATCWRWATSGSRSSATTPTTRWFTAGTSREQGYRESMAEAGLRCRPATCCTARTCGGRPPPHRAAARPARPAHRRVRLVRLPGPGRAGGGAGGRPGRAGRHVGHGVRRRRGVRLRRPDHGAPAPVRERQAGRGPAARYGRRRAPARCRTHQLSIELVERSTTAPPPPARPRSAPGRRRRDVPIVARRSRRKP